MTNTLLSAASTTNSNTRKSFLKQLSTTSTQTSQNQPYLRSEPSEPFDPADSRLNHSTSVGVVVNLQGAPESTPCDLILPVCSISVEGSRQSRLRKADKKFLEKLVPPVRDALMELYNSVSPFDYEVQQEHQKWWRKAQSRKKRKLTRLEVANSKIKAFKKEVILVKREENLIGTRASIYYLLVRDINKQSFANLLSRRKKNVYS
eukprot:snap_masked-scaffold_1-processed-gene-18.18-mRNA-1 protein AED:1.00 eAED:1.00 QI:0/-1/0/0/-1/1/1/0/204